MTELLGKLFHDFDSLKCFIKEYEKTNFVQLSVQTSRTIERQKRISQTNKKLSMARKELVYCRITYQCIHGGKFKSSGTGQRKTVSFKQNCPFLLKFNLSRNAQNLVITKIEPNHNHEVLETVFKSLPRQRRLSDNEKAAVKEMLYFEDNKKLVRKHIVESTGKTVLMKDLHNMKFAQDKNLIRYLEPAVEVIEEPTVEVIAGPTVEVVEESIAEVVVGPSNEDVQEPSKVVKRPYVGVIAPYVGVIAPSVTVRRTKGGIYPRARACYVDPEQFKKKRKKEKKKTVRDEHKKKYKYTNKSFKASQMKYVKNQQELS